MLPAGGELFKYLVLQKRFNEHKVLTTAHETYAWQRINVLVAKQCDIALLLHDGAPQRAVKQRSAVERAP